MSLKRWRVWNIFTKIILLLVYLTLIFGGIYLEFFYTPSYETAQTYETTQTEELTETEIFTKETLAQYNGENGERSYAAIDGIVYDVSDVFKNGWHKGHQAGQEMSDAYYSEHSKSMLKKYPVVGSYQE